MSQPNIPIKRSAELAPLSREHHEGLLAVWKIRQGLANQVASARIAAFIQWFWQQHLQPHFEKEEKFIPRILSSSRPLLQQMLHEHAEIKMLVADAIQHEDLKKLEVVAQTVNDHIRFEERQLFAEIERTATPDQLRRLATELHDEPVTTAWDDTFWLQKS